MWEDYKNKSRLGRFQMMICCIFLVFPSHPQACHSSHLALVNSSTTKNLIFSRITLTQMSFYALEIPHISTTEKNDLLSPKAGSTTNRYRVCIIILAACLVLFSLMLLWVRHTQKKYLILKVQNEELLNKTSKNPKNNEADHKCFLSLNNDTFKLMDSIFVKSHERMVKIPLKDILYIQADRNYCCLCTKEKEYLVVMPLKEFYQKLSSAHFLRIHRSYVINLLHIQEIGTGHVVVERKSLPLSKSSKEELLKHLQTF